MGVVILDACLVGLWLNLLIDALRENDELWYGLLCILFVLINAIQVKLGVERVEFARVIKQAALATEKEWEERETNPLDQ